MEESANPYAPPESSGIAKTMGVLSIIFGALVGLANLWGIVTATTKFRPTFGNNDPADLAATEEFTRQVMPYTLATGAMMVVMSLALVVIGVGLYKQRAMARKAAIYWSFVGFAVLAIRTWMFEVKIWPRMEPFMRQVMERVMQKQHAAGKDMPFDPSAVLSNIGHASQYVSVVILAIFPALLLLLLNLPSVKERLQTV